MATGTLSGSTIKPLPGVTGGAGVNKTMEERAALAQKNMAAAEAASTPATPTVSAASAAPKKLSLQDTFVQRQKESADKIGNLYNQQYNAQAANLKTAYDQNMSNLQAQQQKIAPQYQTQANQMATAYERNRRNANMSALSNGLGTGVQLQQQDALNRQFQQNYSGLKASEANAQAAATQKMADLTTAYNNNLASARTDVENKKAAALVENQNTQNNWYDQQAKLLAGYGDFSAYERLYGKDTTDQMKEVWIIQNPEAALGAGLIDKKKYKKITGHDAGTGPKK